MHNSEADSVLDCDGCMEIVTNPNFGSGIGSESRALEEARGAHFAAIFRRRCEAQYGKNEDLCNLPIGHRDTHSNRWGTTWENER